MDLSRSKTQIQQQIKRVERASKLYGFDLDRVLVATSGGKDSTLLAILLREMQVPLKCVIVDMGYDNFDSAGILRALEDHQFDVDVISLRSTSLYLSTDVLQKIANNFEYLDSPNCKTPCGACSINKRLALTQYANEHNITEIALGHHADDFIVTMLKDYFVEHYYKEIGQYEPHTFKRWLKSAELDISSLTELCKKGLASTMATHLRQEQTSIIRPLCLVRESDIQDIVTKSAISTFSSGCSHDVFDRSDTAPSKRELVHEAFRYRLGLNASMHQRMLKIALSTLDASGKPLYNPRTTRDQRLSHL